MAKIVQITAEQDLESYKFSCEMGNSCSYYKENRSANADLVQKQTYYSKCAEFAVAKFLYENKNYPWLDPDTSIYSGSKKSWKADLPYSEIDSNKFNIHVKSCCALSKYKDSWTFQLLNYNGKGGTDRLFFEIEGFDPKNCPDDIKGIVKSSCKDHIAFVEMSHDIYSKNNINTASIKAILPWKTVVEEGKLKLPLLEKYKNQKRCVYYPDLKLCHFSDIQALKPS